jgi:flagellar hook protein FlgE
MMRAMFAAIAGLRNHITYMDVVGNNIANVNTTAFKSSRVTFQDMLSQTLTGASAPTPDRGGTNPVQVGLGMQLGSIDVFHGQGSLQSTGKLTDFAIQGSGFFMLKDGGRIFYTRDGAFDVAVSGELVNPTNGFKVQGWQASTAGVIDTTTPVGAITIPFGQSVAAQPSTAMTFAGNLDSRLAVGSTLATTVDVFDSLGKSHPVTVTFTKNAAANTWDVTVASTDPQVTGVARAPVQVVFNASGAITTPAPPAPLVLTTTLAAAAGANSPITTNIDVSKVTQFAAAGQISTTFNNGYSAGSLVTFAVGPSGDITGIFSNGTNRPLGQIAMALFTNASGLQRSGQNSFEPTSSSGIPIVGTPGTGGRGTIGTGVLESSNTDLAREFTNVVIAQRGFQASSRVISSADEMLQDLVNLKR